MITKHLLVIFLGGLLFLSNVLLIPDSTQAQQILFSSRGSSDLYMIPKGGITIWCGDETTIPHGWQLCDGTNGTPDLRDRFVRGGEMPNEKGGSMGVLLTNATMPKHSHAFSTTIDGAHSHTIYDHYRPWVYYHFEPTYTCIVSGYPPVIFESETWEGGEHSHTGTTDYQGASLPYDNRPAFYKLAFIMKLF